MRTVDNFRIESKCVAASNGRCTTTLHTGRTKKLFVNQQYSSRIAGRTQHNFELLDASHNDSRILRGEVISNKFIPGLNAAKAGLTSLRA